MQKLRSGVVIHGDQTGRTLGFPTANFDASLAKDIERDGIYAATVKYAGKTFLGALYLGSRLTLGETKRVLEINLLDFDGDLYDQILEFSVEAFIRAPKNFDSVEELKKQLAEDVLAVRRALV